MHFVRNCFMAVQSFPKQTPQNNMTGYVSWLQIGNCISMHLLSFHREPFSFKYL